MPSSRLTLLSQIGLTRNIKNKTIYIFDRDIYTIETVLVNRKTSAKRKKKKIKQKWLCRLDLSWWEIYVWEINIMCTMYILVWQVGAKLKLFRSRLFILCVDVWNGFSISLIRLLCDGGKCNNSIHHRSSWIKWETQRYPNRKVYSQNTTPKYKKKIRRIPWFLFEMMRFSVGHTSHCW